MTNLNSETIKLAIMASLAGWVGTTFKNIPSMLMNKMIYFTSNTLYANTDDGPTDYTCSVLALRKMTRKSFYNKHLGRPIFMEGGDPFYSMDDLCEAGYICGEERDEINNICATGKHGVIYEVMYKPLPEGIHLVYLGELTWARFTHSQVIRETVNDGPTRDKVRKNFSINFIGLKANKYKSIFINNILDLRKLNDVKRKEQFSVARIPDRLVYWGKPEVCISPRYRESVFSKHKDKLIDAISVFSKSEDKYNKLGIPYKLNILLHGIPGTGKTSIVKMLATHCTLHGYIVPWDNRTSNNDLMNRRSHVKGKVPAILLLEEIDTIAVKRETGKDKEGNDKKVDEVAQLLNGDNLKDILETLDGTKTMHGMVSVSTTNHIEKLDPAVIRRFDLVVEIANLDRDEAAEMCDFYEVDRKILDTLEFPINPSRLSRILLEANSF